MLLLAGALACYGELFLFKLVHVYLGFSEILDMFSVHLLAFCLDVGTN